MKHLRKDLGNKDLRFVILSFELEESDPALNDKIVKTAAEEEDLRPVSNQELFLFRRKFFRHRNFRARLVAFGNPALGPAENGAFLGVLFLSNQGEIEVAENWARGNTGDKWSYDDTFLFAPASCPVTLRDL